MGMLSLLRSVVHPIFHFFAVRARARRIHSIHLLRSAHIFYALSLETDRPMSEENRAQAAWLMAVRWMERRGERAQAAKLVRACRRLGIAPPNHLISIVAPKR